MTFPLIADTDWLVEEVRDGDVAGRRRVALDAIALPTGTAVRVYSGPLPYAGNEAAIHRLAATRAIAPGESWLSDHQPPLPVGIRVHTLLLSLDERGRWRRASASVRCLVVQGLRAPDAAAAPCGPGAAWPLLLAAPALAGTGRIGQTVALDPGLWAGAPALDIRWLRDGEEIAGATGVSYRPSDADDLSELRVRVVATGPAGSRMAETAVLRVTHAPPAAVGELFDEVFDQGTGPQAVPAEAAFSGAGLRFTATGAGARADPLTGMLSIPTDAAVDGGRVTVTARNSGGAASRSFLVTVEAGAPGSTAILAADSAAGFPVIRPAALEDALERPLTRFNQDIAGGSASSNARFGQSALVLALSSYAGVTASDARLLRQLKYSVEPAGRNEPMAEGGYPLQHQVHLAAAAVVAKRTPRVWEALAPAERARWDAVMTALAVTSAFVHSDANPYVAADIRQRDMRGGRNIGRNYAPNFRCAPINMLLCASAYFGAFGDLDDGVAAVTGILDNFDMAGFAATCRKAGLLNLQASFGRPRADVASEAEVQHAISSWTAFGRPLGNVDFWIDWLRDQTVGKLVTNGLDGGAGRQCADGSYRGMVLRGESPYFGQRGMWFEFDSRDNGGTVTGPGGLPVGTVLSDERSSVSYAISAPRQLTSAIAALLVSGMWDAARHAVVRAQLEVGYNDALWKIGQTYLSRANGGPKNVAHTGTGSGNETFTRALFEKDFGGLYTEHLWKDVLYPATEP